MAKSKTSRLNLDQRLARSWYAMVILGLIFWVMSYAFLSLAIDTGHFWQYVLAGLLFCLGVKEFAGAVRALIHR